MIEQRTGPPVGERRGEGEEERAKGGRLRTLIADGPRRRRLIALGGLITLVVVAALSLLARLYTVLPVDVWFTRELQRFAGPAVIALMELVSLPGFAPWSTIIVVVIAALVGLLLGWRDGLYLLAITIGQGLLNALIKNAVGRPRPIDSLVDVVVPAQGYSFPSGHVMFYTVFFGFLLFLVFTHATSRPLRWLLALPLAALVILVGPSRIILGAHWLSDVAAAYMIGLTILALAIEGYGRAVAPAAHRDKLRPPAA